MPERDRAELALLEGRLARDMPVLAVCRGSQVLNVARGGDLVQHLPDVVGDDKHKHTPGTFADHDVTLEPGTRLAGLLGERAPVKSHHHQGFGRVGDGLRVAAHAEDGTIEAVEDPSHRFALGVLWHPEAGEDLKLFEELVGAARRLPGGALAVRVPARRIEAERVDEILARQLGRGRARLAVRPDGLLHLTVDALDLECLRRSCPARTPSRSRRPRGSSGSRTD